MRNRDKAILNDLKRFRCMSRDDIIDLHFQGLNNAVTCCNTVMKRLRRDGHVDANVSRDHLYISLNLLPFERLAKRFPTSSALWTYTNNSYTMKNQNYLK